jgi:hypothetical protein
VCDLGHLRSRLPDSGLSKERSRCPNVRLGKELSRWLIVRFGSSPVPVTQCALEEKSCDLCREFIFRIKAKYYAPGTPANGSRDFLQCPGEFDDAARISHLVQRNAVVSWIDQESLFWD